MRVVTPASLSRRDQRGQDLGDGRGVGADVGLCRRDRVLGIHRNRQLQLLELGHEVVDVEDVEECRIPYFRGCELRLASTYSAVPPASCFFTNSAVVRPYTRVSKAGSDGRGRDVGHALVDERLLEDPAPAHARRADARREVEDTERLHRLDRQHVGTLRGLVGAGRLHELEIDGASPRLVDVLEHLVLVDRRRRAATLLVATRGLVRVHARHRDLIGRELVPEDDDLDRVLGDPLRGGAPVVVAFLPLLHTGRSRVNWNLNRPVAGSHFGFFWAASVSAPVASTPTLSVGFAAPAVAVPATAAVASEHVTSPTTTASASPTPTAEPPSVPPWSDESA